MISGVEKSPSVDCEGIGDSTTSQNNENPFIVTCKMTATLGLLGLSTLLLVQAAEPNVIPLEAAFQGKCEDGNPCDQNCFNIHNEMYECDCKEGFVLHANGYSCMVANTTVEDSKSDKSPISIQIEVDIDPPPSKPGDATPTEEELRKLGLPSHHVHYSSSAISSKNNINYNNNLEDQFILPASEPRKHPSEELLEPSDIHLTYSETDDKVQWTDPKEREWNSYSNYQEWNTLFGEDGGSGEEPEPPRALPAVEEYKDHVFEIDAFCNLDCGNGECFMERAEADAIKKRCLCPLGKTGEKCGRDLKISVPQFSGRSHLMLPTLTNAYSDLQLTIEFKPESENGVLLTTGETQDMTGDYLALLIRDGHVELRLDCGTGPGIVRTTDQIHLNRWNRLTVFRHDWGVWLQLNDGQHEEGRSQGLFSRMTFAQPVVLGGVGPFLNTNQFLDTDQGFKGCVRRLEINNKQYNFDQDTGDAIGGKDIDECPVDSCSTTVPCLHHGTCAVPPGGGPGACQCPIGFAGQFCEQAVDVKIPSFNASSHLTLSSLGPAVSLWTEIELVLKPTGEDGLVLYNGKNNDGSNDFIAVFMSRGFIEVAVDLGDGVTIVRSEFPLSLDSWHTVLVSRTGRLLDLQVDSQRRRSQMSAGAFTQLTAQQNLYVGGVPTFALVSPYIPIRTGFVGCIQKLVVNDSPVHLMQSALAGTNVQPCDHPCNALAGHPSLPCGIHGTCRPRNEDFVCECPIGRAGNLCQVALSDVPTPSFGGDSYLYFNDPKITKQIIGNTNSLNLRAKVVSSDGLLLWTGGLSASPASDYLLLGVVGGFLQFRFNLGSGEGILTFNQTRIDDGLWHRIRATRTEQTASLRVDNNHIVTGASRGKLRQLNGDGQLYIGGAEDIDHLPVKSFRRGIIGCIGEVTLGTVETLNLLSDARTGRNIENCLDAFN